MRTLAGHVHCFTRHDPPGSSDCTVIHSRSNKVDASGLTWAYRTGEVDKEAAKGLDYPPVVLLHGIGSSSYSYRSRTPVSMNSDPRFSA